MSIDVRARVLGLVFVLLAGVAGAEVREFDLLRLESTQSGPLVLVLGGIQGDEPGGFHAAALLATRYRVTRGRVWIVPNLNFHSILRRHRGIHGDLNRKFAALAPDDSEYDLVQSIKALIAEPDVALIFNLHDGSGFYHPQAIDGRRNPQRWGQSVVIDGAGFDAGEGRSLGQLAQAIVGGANRVLPQPLQLGVKNTRTAAGDRDMQQALTWYALSQGKPAVASEASKDLATAERVWSHLAVIEAGLSALGVAFERDFALDREAVAAAIESGLQLKLDGGRSCLPLDDVRPILRGLPLVGGLADGFSANNPLLALRRRGEDIEVRFGNRRLTTLQGQRFEPARMRPILVEVDGERRTVDACERLTVVDSFSIEAPAGYRVNAIGAGGLDDQSRVLRRADFDPAYSIDRAGRSYRLEVYREQAFAGMINLQFTGAGEAAVHSASRAPAEVE